MQPRRVDPDRDDFPALLALIRLAFAGMDGRIDPPSSVHALTVEGLREKARSETGFVIDKGERPIACLFCRPEPPDTLYLGKLAILPEEQGRGLGWRLLGAAEGLAGSSGLTCLRLETRIELVENHATFEAWGFVKTGFHSHPGHDKPTSVEMRKWL